MEILQPSGEGRGPPPCGSLSECAEDCGSSCEGGSARVAQHQALQAPQEAAFHWLHHSTSPGDGFRVSTWGGSRAAVWEEAVFAQRVALDLIKMSAVDFK